MSELRKIITEIKDTLGIECCNVKTLKGDKLTEIGDYFGITFDGKVYFNNSNLIITSRDDWDKIQYYVKHGSVVGKIDLSEYSIFIVILNYVNTDELYRVIAQ